MNSKEKIKELNFARACAVLGVIISHFASANSLRFPVSDYYNLSLSSLSVCCFLIISGISMFYNYETIPDLKGYFIKQWKRLFPAFYLVWIIFYLENVFQYGNFLYKGTDSLSYFILSLTGFDGYLYYLFPKVYYITGEWFFGVIIILRLLFPLLLFFVNRTKVWGKVVFWIVLAGLYAGTFLYPLTGMYRLRTVPYCLLCFMIGWIIQKTAAWRNKVVLGISVICMSVVLFVDLPKPVVEIYTPLGGVCAVIILLSLGKWVMKLKPAYVFCNSFSRLSFMIYLLQHIIIYKVFATEEFREAGTVTLLLLLVLTVAVIYFCSFGLDIILKRIMSSRSKMAFANVGPGKNAGFVVLDVANSWDESVASEKGSSTLVMRALKPVQLTVPGNSEMLINVYVNEKPIDRKCYSITKGSTIITFTNEFLATLPKNTELEIVMEFGDEKNNSVRRIARTGVILEHEDEADSSSETEKEENKTT